MTVDGAVVFAWVVPLFLRRLPDLANAACGYRNGDGGSDGKSRE